MLPRRAHGLTALMAGALAGCQGANPYTDQSAPLPPAPANPPAVSTAYPAAPLDYSSYRHWTWRTPPAGTGPISADTVQEIVASELDQRGLRPAPEGRDAGLAVSAQLATETRVRQVYDDYGGYGDYGYGYGGYGRGHSSIGLWGSPRPRLRQYEEQVAVVRLNFYDAATGQQVWSNGAEVRAGDSQAEQREALREAVEKALSSYPPR